jgi:hypothetical protein
MLPDDALLEIFDSYMDEDEDIIGDFEGLEVWITLTHVCRRWRSLVFQSPLRLNLRLRCTAITRVKDNLDIWPSLPLVICVVYFIDEKYPIIASLDNIIAALEHNDRVRQIDLPSLKSSQFGYVMDSAAVQKPFPELTHLHLGGSFDGPMLPDSFLGGTAPRLRSLHLSDVRFPGLPKLLLSAIHLVKLDLYISRFVCYIPPEAMATTLSALTNLECLRLRFPYPRPPLDTRRPPPPPPPLTRSILPSLTKIRFRGASEYLEEILARIDAPRLNELHITFVSPIMFDTPQLFQFVSRRPTLRVPERGHIAFNSTAIIVKFPSQASDYGVLSVEIPSMASEWQLSSIKQVCISSLPPVSMLEDLYIFEDREYPPHWQDDVENTLWLELLHPFAAVKNLYLCGKIVAHIAPALQEFVGGRTTELLPTLENIFLEGLQRSGPLHEGIEKFVTARQLTSHPVAVSRWDMDLKQYRFPLSF